jgi:HEAT repeat protein
LLYFSVNNKRTKGENVMSRIYLRILFTVITALVGNSYATSEGSLESENQPQRAEMQALEEALKTPKTFLTGIRSGRVVDATTNKPIEGAVVFYDWDVREFLIESSSRRGALYETATDKDGKYLIPSQSIKAEVGVLSDLEPEHVFVYKYGYIWYRVFDNKVQSFLTYLPDLQQRYCEKDNVVKLQPWIDELSHAEHVGIFTRMSGFYGTKLEQALEEEKALAKEERNVFKRKLDKAKKQLSQDITAYQNNKIAKEEYIDHLRHFLNIPDSDLLRRTSNTLKKLDDRATIQMLIESLNKHLYRESFETIIAFLNHITGREDLEDTDIISERAEVIKDLEQWWNRNKNRSKPEWFADLLLNGRTEKTRGVAVNKLQQMGDETVVPYIVKYLDSKNNSDSVYPSVFNLLVRLGDDTCIPHIKRKLYHEDIYVRRESALALNKLADQSGVPIMIESLKSKFKNNRSVANTVLKEITTQDFTEGKSLRQLSLDEEKAAIERWITWWVQNKTNIKADEVTGFTEVLKGEANARARYHAAAKEAEKNNPDLPTFDDLEKTPQATLEKFKTALLAGNDEKALSYMAPHIAEKYREIFPLLGPHRRDFVEGMGDIYFDMELSNVLYYEMLTERDEGRFSFPIHFTQDLDGNWIITMF